MRQSSKVFPKKPGSETVKYILLLIPCILGLAWPLYNMVEPRILGVPFFYAYLLTLIPVSCVFIHFASKVEDDV